MVEPLVKTIDGLRAFQYGLTCLGRIYALSVLANGSLKIKTDLTAASHTCLRQAAAINNFVREYYKCTAQHVAWGSLYNPVERGLLNDGHVVGEKVVESIADLRRDLRATALLIKNITSGQPLLTPTVSILSSIFAEYEEIAAPLGIIIEVDLEAKCGVMRSITGPKSVPIDDSFRPMYSLLEREPPHFGATAKEAAPYFWSLAVKESLAADLCALSIIEYDGMPLQFYVDMSKQAWDEMRHSQFFFDSAVRLLPEALAEISEGEPFFEDIKAFIESGKGLPIPKEKNLYEAILNAGLSERLILMHLDTEAPGVARIKQKMLAPFSVERPWLTDSLSIVMRDEITHAGFGKKWLEYLIPDDNDRKETISNARLLRGVYLLTSFVYPGGPKLGDLLSQFVSMKLPPVNLGLQEVVNI